jgi:hypothetical protein
LRLNLDSKINDDLSVSARLSMYRGWGDSTGVQVFDGQPTSMNIDGTTAGVPNGDMLRVERVTSPGTTLAVPSSIFPLDAGRPQKDRH